MGRLAYEMKVATLTDHLHDTLSSRGDGSDMINEERNGKKKNSGNHISKSYIELKTYKYGIEITDEVYRRI